MNLAQDRRRESERKLLLEKSARLLQRKDQVRWIDIEQFVACAQARHGEGRVAACEQHKVQGGGQVLQKKAERLHDPGRIDDVEIIKNQDSGMLKPAQGVKQDGEHHIQRLEWGQAMGKQHFLGSFAKAGEELPACSDDIAPEADRIVIAL